MLRTIGFIMLGGGILLFVISLVLMVVFKVPELIDELSGRKAKRQIKRLREINEGTGSIEGMDTSDFYMLQDKDQVPLDLSDPEAYSKSRNLDTTSTDVDKELENIAESVEQADDTDDEEESATENIDDSEEGATDIIDQEDESEEGATDIIDPEGESNEEDGATDILSGSEEEALENHVITILEEQSSID